MRLIVFTCILGWARSDGPCDVLEQMCWEKCGRPLIFPFRETCAEGPEGGVTICHSPPGCECEIPESMRSRYSTLTSCVERRCESYDWSRLIPGSTKWCQACGYDCNGNQANCISQNQYCTTSAGCGLLRMCDRWRCENGFEGDCDESTPTPTQSPTQNPSQRPTPKPSKGSPVTRAPTSEPTPKPSMGSTPNPTSSSPTLQPSSPPTLRPTSLIPTPQPTLQPSSSPTPQPTSNEISRFAMATGVAFWLCMFGVFVYAVYRVIAFHKRTHRQIVSVDGGLTRMEEAPEEESSDDDDEFIQTHMMPMATSSSTRQQLRRSMVSS